MKHEPSTKEQATPAFTPGPWHPGCFVNPASKCQCTYILAEKYCGSIAVVTVGNEKPIGQGGNDSPPIEEARANARLIAAAPELLEALNRLEATAVNLHCALQSTAQMDPNDTRIGSITRRVVRDLLVMRDEARTAIAKATPSK